MFEFGLAVWVIFACQAFVSLEKTTACLLLSCKMNEREEEEECFRRFDEGR